MDDSGPQALGRLLADRSVEPLFQPVVDLDHRTVVAYEALARGPQGPLHSPTDLFSCARQTGQLTELDWLCRESAVDVARSAGVRSPLSLFVNAEPETLINSRGDAERWAQFGDVRCYLELTERALASQPGELLAAVDQVRSMDWGVALDDVGADPTSLALLPLLQPDVIKLDLRLLQQRPAGNADTDVARVVHAALAQAQATGAVVVAEGIETEEHLELALGYGAQYGQGFLLGRPSALPDPLATPPVAVPLLSRVVDRAVAPGPFALIASSASSRSLSDGSVVELARQLLAQAVQLHPEPVVLVAAPEPLADCLLELLLAADELPLMTIFNHPQSGLPSVPLVVGDPAHADFAVVVVTAHFTAALVARPSLPDQGRFDTVLTFDRNLAIAAGNALLERL